MTTEYTAADATIRTDLVVNELGTHRRTITLARTPAAGNPQAVDTTQ